MMIDLHGLAAGAEPANANWVDGHWGAAFQPIIILLGSIPRFFLNDMRPRHNPKSVDRGELLMLSEVRLGPVGGVALGVVDAKGRHCEAIRQPWGNIVLGSVCYVAAIGLWIFTTLNLLFEVGYPHEKAAGAAREDAYLIWVIAILQIGYPIMSTVQILWLNCFSKNMNPEYLTSPMPGNQMDQLLSTIKDTVYGTLDTSTKGGLALFCALRAAR